MKLTSRQRLLFGALGVAGLVGVVDWFTRSGPRVAAAQPVRVSSEPSQSVRWKDVGDAVEKLTGAHYSPAADKLAELDRDLFLPTPLLRETFHEPEPEPDEVARAQLEAEVEKKQAEFVAVHSLDGILLGQKPFAVIDGRLFTVGSLIDGHLVAQVHRSHVVLEHAATRQQVTLYLKERPEEP